MKDLRDLKDLTIHDAKQATEEGLLKVLGVVNGSALQVLTLA